MIVAVFLGGLVLGCQLFRFQLQGFSGQVPGFLLFLDAVMNTRIEANEMRKFCTIRSNQAAKCQVSFDLREINGLTVPASR